MTATLLAAPIRVRAGAPAMYATARWAVVALLAAVTLALFAFPVKRMTADLEVNYNEGWNVYRQQMAADGVPLYAAPPGRLTGETGYPPLSFHVVAWLGRAAGGFTVAGRWLSLLSLVLTGALVGLIVRNAGGAADISIASALLYQIGIAVLFPSRIGMNDPELFAGALAVAGLYFYLKNPQSRRLLVLSALAFALALFSKQTMLAFPAAVGIDLLVHHRRRFLYWTGVLAAAGLLLLALTLFIDGRAILPHWLVTRSYSVSAAWHDIVHEYLITFQALLAASAVWIALRWRMHLAVALAFVLGHALAFLLAGTEGIELNVCFTPFVAAAIACGLLLADLEPLSPRIAGALLAALAVTVLISVPGKLKDNLDQSRTMAARQAEFRSVVGFLRAHPGPALCESLQACYEAGKPFEFYTLFVRDQLRLGRIPDAEIAGRFTRREFAAVQLTVDRAALEGPNSVPKELRHFTPAMLRELGRNYHLAIRTAQMQVYIPGPSSE